MVFLVITPITTEVSINFDIIIIKLLGNVQPYIIRQKVVDFL